MEKLQLKIITPERIVYEQESEMVSLTTESGDITILPGHLPLVTLLKSGELLTRIQGEEISLAVSGGFAQITNNTVTILADSGERSDEIDEARAEAAKIEAQKALELYRNTDAVAYNKMVAQLEKELARLKVVRRRKKVGQK